MEKFIERLISLPKWVAVLFLILITISFISFFYFIISSNPQLTDNDSVSSSTFIIIFSVISLIAVAVSWVIGALFIHLLALLFKGHGSFSKLLFVYPSLFILSLITSSISFYLFYRVSMPSFDFSNLEQISAIINSNFFTYLSIFTAFNIIYYYFLIYVVKKLYSMSWTRAIISSLVMLIVSIVLSIFLHYNF